MRISVTHTPAWNLAMAQWPATVGSILMVAAVAMISDNTEMIHRGLRFDGRKQKENAPSTQRRKRKAHGHSIPLRDKDVLSNPANWRINGRKAGEFVGAFSRRAGRTPALSNPQVWRGIKVRAVSVTMPRTRIQVVLDLMSMGYGTPFGVSAEIREIIKYTAVLEMRSVRDLATYGFRAIFTEVV